MTTPYMGIPDVEPDFGKEFNYAVWTAGTRVAFYNVPWNADYRDIVRFRTPVERDKYFANPKLERAFMSYARVNEPVRVDIPFNACYEFNYLVVDNPAQPISGDSPRKFYYFIHDVRYIAPNTTELVVQLDIWQSFCFYLEFGNCFIERGHIGVANQRANQKRGRDFLTQPEGLDMGNEYIITREFAKKLCVVDTNAPDYGPQTAAHVLMWSSTQVSNREGYGTLESPNLKTAVGSGFESLPNGHELSWFKTVEDYIKFVKFVGQYPWISQGILTVMIVPPFTLPASAQATDFLWHNVTDGDGNSLGDIRYTRIDHSRPPGGRIIPLTDGVEWTEGSPLPERYAHLGKFNTFPYALIELTTYSGTPLVLKPECLSPITPGINLMQFNHFALPSPRAVFTPLLYNSGGPSRGEHLDVATMITNFPTFSVSNDSHLMYMANNSHSIAYQFDNADWSQQRALTANQLGYNQATAGMDLTEQLGGIDRWQVAGKGRLGVMTGAVRDIAAIPGQIGSHAGMGMMLGPWGAVGGAAVGAAVGAVNAGANAVERAGNMAYDVGAIQATTQANVSNQGYMRDTNKHFADFAARGDYAMAIGAINAKVQDAKMIAPTTVGQLGGEAFNLVTDGWQVAAKVKRINPAVMRNIGEYWLRYGYAVNVFSTLPDSLHCMSRFTYWKLRETYVRASHMPETFKQTVRGIFEKGVTVWQSPNDIGVVDIGDNRPLAGINLGGAGML